MPEGSQLSPTYIFLYCLAAEDRVEFVLLSWFAVCGGKSKCSSFVTVLRCSQRKSKTVTYFWNSCVCLISLLLKCSLVAHLLDTNKYLSSR